jgi:uncharacterized OB-fold protein
MSNTLESERTPITGGINADGPYWDALENNEFRLPRCAQCKTWQWPAHFRCGACGSWENEWVEVPPAGTVYSWTRSWYAFDRTQERAEDVPYVVVLAEIADAGGARVMGVLEGDDAGLRIGARVIGTIHPPAAKSKWYPSITWSIQD